MSDKIHGFPEAGHAAKVNAHVSKIPGKSSGTPHGAGVVGTGGAHPGFATPGMDGYGEVTSGQKGHPLTD